MDLVTLRVVEALAKDVGRGIARLDPKDLEQIGAAAGDILSIAGERATVAKAMPAFKDSRGKGVVQIDGITRRNAKLALDQRATVQLSEHAPARRLTLRQSQALLGSASDSRYLARLIEGLPVTAGDSV